MHGLLYWVAAGALAGTIAKFLAGGWNLSGLFSLIVGGILGAVGAGYLCTAVMKGDLGDGTDTVAALVGATIVLWIGAVLFPRHSL